MWEVGHAGLAVLSPPPTHTPVSRLPEDYAESWDSEVGLSLSENDLVLFTRGRDSCTFWSKHGTHEIHATTE